MPLEKRIKIRFSGSTKIDLSFFYRPRRIGTNMNTCCQHTIKNNLATPHVRTEPSFSVATPPHKDTLSCCLGGVIIAGGQSSRMNACKALLTLGDRGPSILERTTNVIRNGVQHALVVTGYHKDAVTQEAERLNLADLHNKNAAKGMFSSIITGFKALLKKPVDGMFLLPVDIALTRPSTIQLLLEDFAKHKADITYPVLWNAKTGVYERGHPPLLSCTTVQNICAMADSLQGFDSPGGLRAILKTMAQDGAIIREVAVADEGILMDMDTPCDYADMQKRYATHHVPSIRERDALFHMVKTPPHVKAHGVMVARAALCLATHLEAVKNGTAPMDFLATPCALPDSFSMYDYPCIHMAALLHDICKGFKLHEQLGGDLLKRHGFAQVGEIIAQHKDVNPSHPTRLDESHLVMLADKYICEETLIPLEDRFNQRIRQWQDNPSAAQAITRRKERAMALSKAYEKAVTMDAYAVLQKILLTGC